jgi:hypothetical protein
MLSHLNLLQAAAVTAVACVLIVGACADLFSLEQTGLIDPGTGLPVRAIKYQGKLPNICRYTMLLVITLIAAVYTGILGAILSSVFWNFYTPNGLENTFVIAICVTIMAVCWIAFLATWARWNYLRDS